VFPTASVPSMVGTHEYHGFWWLPGHQDQKLAGKLTLGKGDVQLELLGHYGHELLSDSGTERIFSLDLKEQPRVVGMTTNGKQVTLEGHRSASSTTSIPGIATSTYRREVALIGKTFAADEEIAFDEIAIEASDLNAWTGVTGLQMKLGFEEHEQTGLAMFTNVDIRFDAPNQIEIPLEHGESAAINFRATSEGIDSASTHVRLRQEAALHLRFAEPSRAI
jgi:hypothetical protein